MGPLLLRKWVSSSFLYKVNKVPDPYHNRKRQTGTISTALGMAMPSGASVSLSRTWAASGNSLPASVKARISRSQVAGEAMSAATCTKAKPICENMPGLVGRAARLARQGKGKQEITDALTFDEPWARVDIGKSPIEGPVDAPITVVEYSEFQCPFCRRAQETMEKIEEAYHGKVRFVFKHFPLSKHKLAKPAAIASMAAGYQGQFWPYKALLFERQRDLRKDGIFEEIAGQVELDQVRWKRDLENPEIEAIIKADVGQAKKLGVRGTPTFFVNGYKLRGAKPFGAFQELIDAELADLKG